jgi:hypothetical protein
VVTAPPGQAANAHRRTGQAHSPPRSQHLHRAACTNANWRVMLRGQADRAHRSRAFCSVIVQKVPCGDRPGSVSSRNGTEPYRMCVRGAVRPPEPCRTLPRGQLVESGWAYGCQV